MLERTLADGGTLTARSLRVARAVAACMFDAGGGIPDASLDAFLVDLADWARYSGPKTRFALRASLLITQWTPLITIGRPRRFSSLARADQTRHLLELEHRPIFALVFAGMKTVLAILWFEIWGAPDLPPLTRIERPAELIVRRAQPTRPEPGTRST